MSCADAHGIAESKDPYSTENVCRESSFASLRMTTLLNSSRVLIINDAFGMQLLKKHPHIRANLFFGRQQKLRF
jgi:hypothetical protein